MNLTLTVNSRLARWLLLQHHGKQKRAGRKAWDTPEILPLSAWTQRAWLQSWPKNYILSDLQSNKLWEEIIRRDPQTRSLKLLRLQGVAELASKAYALIQEYRLTRSLGVYPATEETGSFQRWLGLYERRLNILGALDPASVMDEVLRGMQEDKIPAPDKIVLAGFEEVTPQLQDWLTFLQENNAPVKFEPPLPDNSPTPLIDFGENRTVRAVEFKDRKQEVLSCVRWVRCHFELRKTVGIVVPEMNEYRALLKRELAAELTPDSVYPWINKETPYNISLGGPLSEEPVIQIALKFLSIENETVTLPQFSEAAASLFFFSGQKESDAIAALALKLGKQGRINIRLDQLLETIKPESTPHLASFIKVWRQTLQRGAGKTPTQWAVFFSSILREIGWPANAGNLTDREYQAHQKWKECLDEFSTLDLLLGSITRPEAAKTLNQIIEKEPFQIKTREQPIQVVGLLESAGMQFDRLWVLGCHADILPSPPAPNPFLALEIQKKYGIPHSSAQRELDFAEKTLKRLLTSSREIIFSSPMTHDNAELKPSPLLTPFSSSFEEPLESHRIKDLFAGETPMEILLDPHVTALSPHQTRFYLRKEITGGYAVLKNQAECPFRAFANHRLHVDPIELPEIDFHSRERGILVHKVLEIFWREVKSRSALQSLKDRGQLKNKIDECAQKAFGEFSGQFGNQSQFLTLEHQRVIQLLTQWMDNELLRGDFEVVWEEKNETVRLGDLKLKLRVDRIDKTANGETLIIDYKTGSVMTNHWLGERILEPQLPLYTLATPPDAIAFAQLKKGELKWRAAFEPTASLQGLKPVTIKPHTSWSELLDDWRENLTAIAEEFLQGQTRVDPIKNEATCKNCGLETLCRVREARGGLARDEDEE